MFLSFFLLSLRFNIIHTQIYYFCKRKLVYETNLPEQIGVKRVCLKVTTRSLMVVFRVYKSKHPSFMTYFYMVLGYPKC